MTKIIKKIIVLVVLMMCLGLFTGCETNKYHAEIFSDNYGFNREFLKSWLDNESSIEDADEWHDKYITDETSLEYRIIIIIIKSQMELDNIF